MSSNHEPTRDRPARTQGTNREWWTLFDDVIPPSRRLLRLDWIRTWAAAGTTGVVCIGLALICWLALIRPDHDPPSNAEAESPSPRISTVAVATDPRLLGSLPPDYPPEACSPIGGRDAVSSLVCRSPAAPSRPPIAIFSLMRDLPAVDTAFQRIISRMDIVVCPGSFQSPGPWHANSAREPASGTLVCGYLGGRPTIAWTTEQDCLVSRVEGQSTGPTMEDLYRWWSSQS